MPAMNPTGGSRLVWMDLEMSGLDPEREVIIEIATLVTDESLQIVAEGPVFAIHHPEPVLAAMDAWNTEHHTASGLVERVRQSAEDHASAEAKTLAFLQQHVGARQSPLCGNSVHQDRRFLVRYMPALEAFFHYRNIDVSTLKELTQRWYPDGPPPPPKRHAHQALDDIRESVEELCFYRDTYFREPAR
jgi:oligoribonuclease